MSTWTDDAIETLRAMWRAGFTAGEIAREIGPPFTRNAVIGKAHRLGLSGRPSPLGHPKYSDATVLDIRRRYRAGQWPVEIARHYNMSRSYCQRICYGDVRADVVEKPNKQNGCQYPLWKDEVTHEYCGVRRKGHSAYCKKHHAVCYRRLRIVEQEAA